MTSIRLLDLGEVPAIRSQTIYHAVARAMDASSPSTIILVSPAEPYVSIGYHQDLEQEVDVAYCRASSLPVVRREVGGGAVYLDRDQVFSQWVFQPSALPDGLDEQFRLYIEPLVETYQAFGVDAYLRPVNDVHVGGKKIGGTGAAQIGDARVLVGSLMFDFDKKAMSRVLKVPSEKMRDKVFESLEEYMTTMAELLPSSPDRAEVIDRYIEQCALALGADIAEGAPTDRELETAAELDELFASDEWLAMRSPGQRAGVKIHAGVHVVEGAHKAPGGLIRATARVRDGHLDDVTLSGDFTILPATSVEEIESALAGVPATRSAVADRVSHAFSSGTYETPGVSPEDFATAVMQAVGAEGAQ